MSEKRVLIIDDDLDLCQLMVEILRSINVSASITTCLFEAKQIIPDQCPSVIILDNSLPDGRGSEFIPYLNENCPEAQILFTSGDSAANKFEGVAQFISKPFSLSTFRSIIEQYTS